MRIIHRSFLFVILAMMLIFTELILVSGQGWWGYGYNSPYYSRADFEQYMWDMEAYYFMNYYDPAYNTYGVPAYSHPIYGNPPYYIPKYTAAPTYTLSPTPTTSAYMASNSTLQYNQATGNGSAAYWLYEGNVSYFTGSYEQAANSYAKAVNLDPSLKIGWLNLGNSLYFLGKYQASSNAYNETLKLDPLNADAMLGKGKDLMALNKKI